MLFVSSIDNITNYLNFRVNLKLSVTVHSKQRLGRTAHLAVQQSHPVLTLWSIDYVPLKIRCEASLTEIRFAPATTGKDRILLTQSLFNRKTREL